MRRTPRLEWRVVALATLKDVEVHIDQRKTSAALSQRYSVPKPTPAVWVISSEVTLLYTTLLEQVPRYR